MSTVEDSVDTIPIGRSDFTITHIDDYMTRYGSHLGFESRRALRPLHDPNVDKPLPIRLKRPPFPAQSHAISAAVKALCNGRDSIFVVGEMGTGKCQKNSEPVLTPQGFVRIDSLSVGDDVIDPQGGVAKVIGVYPKGVRRMYRVTMSDGSSTVCCDEHLWAVNTPERKWRGQPYKVVELKSIMGRLFSQSGNARYFIPMVEPVEYRKFGTLILDPYLLGCHLGDGSYTTGSPSFTTVDDELREAVSAAMPAGVSLKRRAGSEKDYSITATETEGKRGVNSFAVKLQLLGLQGMTSERKFIPHWYKLASVKDRLSMLQGLFDTDGHPIKTGGVEYCTASPDLSRDVIELVRSLGGTATVVERETFCRGVQGKNSFRHYIKLPNYMDPFRLKRKLLAYHRNTKYEPTRAIVSVEYVGDEECRCIAVSAPSHCYVTNDFIVTHNTLLSQAIVDQHARMQRRMQVKGGHAYRCLVFCPPQLVGKWGREIMETIPNASVVTVEKWDDVIRIRQRIGRRRPAKPTYYIISREKAKLSAKWLPVYKTSDKDDELRCCQCGSKVRDEKDRPIEASKLNKSRHFCKAQIEDGDGGMRICNAPLWTYVGANSQLGIGRNVRRTSGIKGCINRWEPAKYIHKHMKRFFDYLIIDEVHEEKSADSAQANAVGALVAATKYHIALTGTLIGGYANHMRPLLWRLCGQKMQRLGYNWRTEMPFNRDYGRIETTIWQKESSSSGSSNSNSRGRTSTKKDEKVKPGIMPTIFGDLLMEQCVFLGLAEISENLPALEEHVVAVDMLDHQRTEYARIEKKLSDVVKDMVSKGDRRLLATMLQTLLCWPDYPFDWKAVGYIERPKPGEIPELVTKETFTKRLKMLAASGNEAAAKMLLEIDAVYEQFVKEHGEMTRGQFIQVVMPKSLDKEVVYPKEQKLLDTVRAEVEQGRQCWVYVQYTGKRDVGRRLQELFMKNGISARCLPASVSPADREEWIAKYGRENKVIISHPKLVETGLDLFDKNGNHNFPTLIFYETGYNTFTLRQASRRSWRIGQTKRCKIFYFYYAGTMQEQAMELMGKKLTASLAMEGKFSSEGLAAMGADDGGIEMALAKKLSALEKADPSQTARAWERISTGASPQTATLAESQKEAEKRIAKEALNINPADALKEIEAYLQSITLKKPKAK